MATSLGGLATPPGTWRNFCQLEPILRSKSLPALYEALQQGIAQKKSAPAFGVWTPRLVGGPPDMRGAIDKTLTLPIFFDHFLVPSTSLPFPICSHLLVSPALCMS